MSQSQYTSGPAVGVGDGTLLVGWPCRVDGTDDPFSLVPMVVWTDKLQAYAAVMEPTGSVRHYALTELQFDPKWKGR